MTCNRIKCLSDCTQNLVKFSAIARLTLKALCFWLWTGIFKVKNLNCLWSIVQKRRILDINTLVVTVIVKEKAVIYHVNDSKSTRAWPQTAK